MQEPNRPTDGTQKISNSSRTSSLWPSLNRRSRQIINLDVLQTSSINLNERNNRIVGRVRAGGLTACFIRITLGTRRNQSSSLSEEVRDTNRHRTNMKKRNASIHHVATNTETTNISQLHKKIIQIAAWQKLDAPASDHQRFASHSFYRKLLWRNEEFAFQLTHLAILHFCLCGPLSYLYLLFPLNISLAPHCCLIHVCWFPSLSLSPDQPIIVLVFVNAFLLLYKSSLVYPCSIIPSHLPRLNRKLRQY